MATTKKASIPRYFSNIQYPYSDSWDAKPRNHISFTLANIHYSIANAIRRSMISKVASVGFKSEPHKYSTINIEKNDTYLNNQIISHRIYSCWMYLMIPMQLS